MTREKAVARLHALAQEAGQRLQRSGPSQNISQSVSLAPKSEANLGAPYFAPGQALEARKAIQQFLKEIQDVTRATPGVQRDPQLLIRFVQPVDAVEVLRAKIARFHGAAGPAVEVAPADSNQTWKKPTSSVWYAERKGDARKCVFKLNVPAEEGAKGKPKSMSLQVQVGGRELSVTAFKSLVLKYGGNLVMVFGPHRSIQVNQTAAAGLDLTSFWGK